MPLLIRNRVTYMSMILQHVGIKRQSDELADTSENGLGISHEIFVSQLEVAIRAQDRPHSGDPRDLLLPIDRTRDQLGMAEILIELRQARIATISNDVHEPRVRKPLVDHVD